MAVCARDVSHCDFILPRSDVNHASDIIGRAHRRRHGRQTPLNAQQCATARHLQRWGRSRDDALHVGAGGGAGGECDAEEAAGAGHGTPTGLRGELPRCPGLHARPPRLRLTPMV
eukprot:198421-Rhodomonas_salina.1